jgi:hypothetical protein
MLPSLRPCSIQLLSDSRRTFVRLSSNDSFKFHPPNFRPSRDFRLMFVELSSCALLSYVLRHVIMRFAVLRIILSSCLFIHICLIFVRSSLDVRLTFVQCLCVTSHSQQCTIFFKLYVVLKFCS